MALGLLSAAGVVVALVAAGILRRRSVARIAARDFARRPAQTTLVVAGLLVSSLVVSAALTAGDATEAMFLDNVYRVWGPVDAIVGTLSGRPFDEAEGRAMLEHPELAPYIDGGAVRLQLPASVEAESAGTRESLINLIGIDPGGDSTLGRFRALDGSEVADPGEGFLINQRLARRLGVGAGTVVRVTTSGFEGGPVTASLPVSAVVQDTGKANFQLRPNAFVRLDLLQSAVGGRGRVNQVALSAGGDDRNPLQVKEMETAALVAANKVPPDRRLPRSQLVYRIAGAKSQSVSSAMEQSRFFESVLGGLGSIVALTSIALIVNLFVMLGEERRSELAMMRALGLKRTGLVLLGLAEGLLYSLTAALLGTAVGAFLGRYIGEAMVGLYGQFLRDQAVEFTTPDFQFRIETLLAAAAAGFLVSVISVGLVSIRTSRLSVVAGIRGLPESRRHRDRPPYIPAGALAVGFILLGAGSFAMSPRVEGALPTLIGGTLVIIGISGILRRYSNPRFGATLGSLAVVGWGMWAYVYLPDFDREFEIGFIVITASAVVIVLGAVVFTSVNLTAIERVGRLFGSRLRAVVRTATAYPVAFRFRTAMSMAMFALVLYMIAAFAVWGGLVGGDPQTQSGGFDVFAQSTVPVEGFAVEGADAVAGMYAVRYELGYRVGSSQQVNFPVAMFGVDQSMADASEFSFADKVAGLEDRQVWEGLAGSDRFVVIDSGTNPGGPGGARAGLDLVLNTDRGPRRLRVIGIVDEFWLGAFFVSKQTFSQLYPTREAEVAWLVKASPGVTADQLAQSAERTYPGIGLDARPVEEILEESASGQRAFVGLFQVLLKLGLIIGISSLSIASVRTVLERRHAVGVVRALGFKRRMVAAWLLIEGILVATLGCAIGLGAGLAGTYWLVDAQLEGFRFNADWNQVGTTLAIVYGAVVAFTIIPAWRAARLKPAEAVRYVE